MVGLLFATGARADMLGPGEKGVKLMVQVDATVPADKVLIIDHTFRGADVVTPGALTRLEWHPLGGEMQVKMIARAEADKLAPLREKLEREAIAAIVGKAVSCTGKSFPGVRTISDTSPAEEARLIVTASVTGDTCTAELTRTDYVDKDGKPVSAPGNTDIPPPAPPTPPAKVEPAPVKTDAKSSAPAKPEAAKTESGGCASIAADQPTAGLALLCLGLLLRRRRG